MVIDTNSLSVSEKIHLVEDLWDSVLGMVSESSISDSEKVILDRALTELDENPFDGMNWELVRERIKNNLHG